MPSRDTNVGAKRARVTREALGLDADAPLACVLTTVERAAGLPVVVARLDDGVAGCCVRAGATAVLFVNGADLPARRRFTLAHEYGHVALGHERATPVDSAEVLAGRTRDAREVQANAFAAEFLAPRDGVGALLDGEPDLEAVVRVAAHFGLSTLAALNRLGTLARTRRYDRLRAEIDAGDHRLVWAYLAPAEPDDELARIAGLPRLSPALAGSELAAMLRGDAPAPADPALRRGLAVITR